MTRFDRAFVWTGGALFVASLTLCAWWYLVPLGRVTALDVWPALADDVVVFGIFALHHSLFARDAVKRGLARIPPQRLRSIYVWTASLLLALVCVLWRGIGGQLYDAAGAAAGAGVVVQLTGVALIARAVGRIDPLELAGIRAAQRPDALQMDGPYRLVRHPLYLGWMLAVFGTPHMTGDRLAFALLTSLYLVAAVPLEERSLRRSFGEAYTRYARDVRWRIIPLVY